MEKIIQILMKRDGIDYDEAKSIVEDAKSELQDAIDGTSCLSPEDVMYGELGLELDYVFYLL